MLPYLPDLLKEVVDKVNLELAKNQDIDFTVDFNHGLESQVWNDVSRQERLKNNPLIWLVMNYQEEIGKPLFAYEAPNIQLQIMTPTEPNWTQEQRDEKTFKPVLFPIYDELMRQIGKSKAFGMPNEIQLSHRRMLKPYWGGSTAGGALATNQFNFYVDAILIYNLRLKVSKYCITNTN
jgi:hypothetical protein